MKTKIKGNQLLCADFKSPDHPYATFDDGITDRTKHEIMLFINYGSEMLETYDTLPNMDMQSVMDMILKLDKIFFEYKSEKFILNRKEFAKE